MINLYLLFLSVVFVSGCSILKLPFEVVKTAGTVVTTTGKFVDAGGRVVDAVVKTPGATELMITKIKP